MAKSEIIKKLARKEIDTETALKQLKLLLLEFPNKKFSSWVNNELTGYKELDEVPDYRKTAGALKGTVLIYNTQASNIGIPLMPDAPKELLEFCNSVVFRESIAALKSIYEHNYGNAHIPFPPDYYSLIIKHSSIFITAVLNAYVSFSSTAIPHIFSEVDNKIMDILLLLEKEFGNLDSLDIDLESKSESEIETIQQNISICIFNSNSISIGDDNVIKGSKFSSLNGDSN